MSGWPPSRPLSSHCGSCEHSAGPVFANVPRRCRGVSKGAALVSRRGTRQKRAARRVEPTAWRRAARWPAGNRIVAGNGPCGEVSVASVPQSDEDLVGASSRTPPSPLSASWICQLTQNRDLSGSTIRPSGTSQADGAIETVPWRVRRPALSTLGSTPRIVHGASSGRVGQCSGMSPEHRVQPSPTGTQRQRDIFDLDP